MSLEPGLSSSPWQRLPAFAIGLAVILIDRWTKSLAEANLDPYRSLPVIPGLFDLTLVRNPGGVFGVFKNLSDGMRGALFTVVPIAAIVLIAVYSARLPASRRFTQGSLALILGGAVGNLVDRFRLGHVVDFLDFSWRGHHWPAFNIADSAICVGVGLLMLESLMSEEPSPEGGGPQAQGHPLGTPPGSAP